MKNVMENLFALQTLQLQSGAGQRNRDGAIEALRKTMPAVVLTRYDRLVAHGKKGVAVVRHGVCSECHISVAIGALADLAHESDVQVCGNCGRYLFLPANEPVVPVSAPPIVKTTRRKRESLAHAVAG
jgi:predicted  nucleic acid-binding Zn-ribbon protein